MMMAESNDVCRFGLTFLSVVLTFAAPAAVAAQVASTAPATQPSPPLVQPTRTFTLPANLDRPMMAADADGGSIYILTTEPSINLWKSLVYCWPEIGTALGCVAALLLVRRIAQRPQVVGELHCRHCNYLLKNIQPERCPECGSALTRRNTMLGSGRAWQISILATLIFVYLLIYLVGGLTDVRQGEAGEWLDWRSTRLAQNPAARKWPRFIGVANEPYYFVLRVDTDTGAIEKIAIDARDDLRGMTPDHDGNILAMWGDKGVYQYDLHSGGRLHDMRLDDVLDRARWADRIISACFSPNAETAYVLLSRDRVEKWDIVHRSTEVLRELRGPDANRVQYSTLVRVGPRIALKTPYDRFLVIEGDSLPPQASNLPTISVLLPDGRPIVCCGPAGSSALVVYPPGGTDKTRYPAPAALASAAFPMLSNDGRWLVMENYGAPQDMFVFDFKNEVWSHQLAFPTGSATTGLAVTGNGSVARLCVIGPPAAPTFQLLHYDLASERSP
jgi:hypothetical protein